MCEAGFNGLEKGQSLQTHEGHLLAKISLRRKNVFREKQLSIDALYLRRILEVAIKEVRDLKGEAGVPKDDFKGNNPLISCMLAPLGCFLCVKNNNSKERLL